MQLSIHLYRIWLVYNEHYDACHVQWDNDFHNLRNNYSFKANGLGEAFRVAIGMSLISMIGMEAAMNIVDYLLTGGAMLTWWVIPIMLFAGFITPWPYNYWRLKKHGKAATERSRYE